MFALQLLCRTPLKFRKGIIRRYSDAIQQVDKKYNVDTHLTSNFIKQAKPSFPRKVFSGIQPTGSVHLGNYAGAIKQWVNLQNKGEDVTICIVDLHAITLPQDPLILRENILNVAATLLACGIDPNKAVLYQQSTIPQHAELNWYLGCISTMARLSHLPQFKEKSASLKEVPLGLYVYPVLQTADILLFKSTHVPVGDDQLQHLQLAQDLARMFNRRYGVTFPLPQSMVIKDGQASKVRSLRNPDKKMSKSDPDAKSRICLTDTPDEIASKVRKSVTDLTSRISYDLEGRPGVSNLLNILSIFSGKTIDDLCIEAENWDTVQLKTNVTEVLVEYMKPIQQKLSHYLAEPAFVLDVLKNGSERLTEQAETTIQEVKTKLGLKLDCDIEKKLKAKVQ